MLSDTTHAPVGLRIRVWMDGGLLISCDWHFVIISFHQFFFRSVRFYLFGHISIWSKFTYTLIKERKQKRKKQKITTKGGKMKKKKKAPINTSYIWILRVLFDHDLVLFWTYYSTFHVSSTFLKYSKSWSESSPFFQGKCPV